MTEFVSGPVTVSVPATSANLGPGFDSLGLALDLRDVLTAQVCDGPLVIEVEGEGVGVVATDAEHLVHRAMVATFGCLGSPVPSLRLHCHNRIPHARGLGSSSAAIVGGIVLALALLDRAADDAVLELATRLEGHPDNVAPALLGGFTIAATELDGSVTCARLEVGPGISGVVFIPPDGVETSTARGLLPTLVPHGDASANTARASLLVAALTERPDLLFAATADRLHQEYRRPAMPDSLALLDRLRADQIAAVVSGAGPSVLALVSDDQVAGVAGRAPSGWRVLTTLLGGDGARVENPSYAG